MVDSKLLIDREHALSVHACFRIRKTFTLPFYQEIPAVLFTHSFVVSIKLTLDLEVLFLFIDFELDDYTFVFRHDVF